MGVYYIYDVFSQLSKKTAGANIIHPKQPPLFFHRRVNGIRPCLCILPPGWFITLKKY
jgi:hypothetical protein